MANTEVNIEWYTDEIARLSTAGGPVDQGVQRAAGKTRDRVIQNVTASGRGGGLREIHSERIQANAQGVFWEVGSKKDYFKYHEWGTRDHGPRRARVLRFKPGGSSDFVFAKWVRGIRAGHFLQNALGSLSESDYL